MTWEEIIIQIRKDPVYSDLVRQAYFDEDLDLNVSRFVDSEEFIETKRIISEFGLLQKGNKLLEVGAGNGIASVAFCQMGLKVTAVEPDASDTIGAGAIRKLKKAHELNELEVVEAWGESLPFPDASFDIVYVRQAVHHAAKLKYFIGECARLLRPGGMLVTVRDHVIYDEKDKIWFLEMHPLHKFYGGENAFTEEEYRNAILSAGLEIKKSFKHFESVINYYPMSSLGFTKKIQERDRLLEQSLKNKLPELLSRNSLIRKLYSNYVNAKLGKVFDEKKVPGRMISFFATKPI